MFSIAEKTTSIKYLPFYDPYFIKHPDLSELKKNKDMQDEVYKIIAKNDLYFRRDTFNKIFFQEFGETFDNPDVYYRKVFNETCCEFLSVRNGVIHLKSGWEDSFDLNKYMKWRHIERIVDKDLFISFVLRNYSIKEISVLLDSPVFASDVPLEKILDQGICEQHMHLGAAKNFAHIWSWVMGKENESFRSIKKMKVYFSNGSEDFSGYFIAAKVLRILFSFYLKCKEKRTEKIFRDFLCCVLAEKNNDFNSPISNTISGNYSIKINDLLFSLIEGDKLLEVALNNDLPNYLIDKFDCKIGNKTYTANPYYNQIIQNDYISEIYNHERNFSWEISGRKNAFILPEYILLKKCMNYIFDEDSYDETFSKLFWQYIRIKNIFFNKLVQQKYDGKGLDVFKTYYDTQNSFEIKDKPLSTALYSQLKGQTVRKFEIRAALKNPSEEVFKAKIYLFLKEYLSFLLGREVTDEFLKMEICDEKYKKWVVHPGKTYFPLLGIVIHLIKSEIKPDKVFKDRCHIFSNDCDIDTPEKKRKKEYTKLAEIISKLRNEVPNLDKYVVGIDTASKELATNPEYFVDAYKLLRNNGNLLESQTIGFTYHVGEDFRDILSGLRSVYEVIENLNFIKGDRIGHGIVLGIDIGRWHENNQVVYLERFEYLKNLIWEWNVSRKMKIEGKYDIDGDMTFIEDEIFRVSKKIFGFVEGMTVYDLHEAYIDLVNCRHKIFNGKDDCPYKNTKEKDGKKSDKDDYCTENDCPLVKLTEKKYHSDNYEKHFHPIEFENTFIWSRHSLKMAYECEFFHRDFNKTEEIYLDKNRIEKYKKIQEYMLDLISRKEIIVELNPSSNLRIGEFNTFRDYHIKRLSNPGGERVIVTINTDDPIVFNTNLTNEYDLIYKYFIHDGKYKNKEILDWIDKIRVNGLRYSFIKDRDITLGEIVEEIKEIMRELKR